MRISYGFQLACVALALGAAAGASAQDRAQLPTPLALGDVIVIATERRDEIVAALAAVRAGEARPAIVSALEDPMVMPALQHLPFSLMGADVNVTVEQRFPLSRIRDHRRDAAVADVGRLRALTSGTVLDVGFEAAAAWLMLQERRRTSALLAEQLAFARDVVSAANARYSGGTAPQSDVLRAEVEVARLEARARALVAEVRGAEAMLNAAVSRDTDLPVPDLAPLAFGQPLPDWAAVRDALPDRPELAAVRAAIARADAEVQVMRDMSRPMMSVRTGPAYSMMTGSGWMAMVGVSLPIWRGRLRAGVAEAEAMRSMFEADLRATARMIEGGAAVARSQVESARERRAALIGDVLPRARMAIEPAAAGYAAGQLPLVSVIEAVQALWLVQADLIAADTDLGLAWVRLGRALGTYEGIQP